MNIPNLLTLTRIILVPVIVIFLMQGEFVSALIATTVSGATDALDGFLARALNQQTLLGAYLDPLADKALITSCFLTLSILGAIPGWLAVIVISRDAVILVGVGILTVMSVTYEVKPFFVSKVTTALQILTVFVILLFLSVKVPVDHFLISWLYGLTALFSIISGLSYMVKGVKYVNNAV
ncbi:MAG: CDP-alcohol phosphatidyltransferase family protein [Smithellaceae bacterium]|nr:CDP-alcohol phosphatidyltransferase family protein [Smithellaceae bacterium]